MKKYEFWILITLCTTSALSAKALNNKLLICLAQEESIIHKNKIKGPRYNLNQLFINELSSYNDFELKDQYFDLVCSKNTVNPSFKLMKYLLTEGTKIFKLGSQTYNESIRALRVSTLNDLKSNMPNVFFQYVSYLQANSPRAHCLVDYIPHLSKFMSRYHYLEKELQDNIFQEEKNKTFEILSQLENINSIYKKCAADLKR